MQQNDLLPEVAPLRQASRLLVRELGWLEEPLGHLEMSRSQCHALIEIERGGVVTAGELCDLLNLDKSTTSRVVAQLLEAKYIAPHDDGGDKRRRPLKLTPKGKKKLQSVHEHSNKQVQDALALLSDQDRQAVIHGMELYSKALRRARRQRNYTLRPIERKDDPDMARIIRTVMPEFGASGPGFAINDPEVDAMYDAYSGSRAGYYVLASGKQILGGGGFAQLAGGDKDICELRKMYFLPEARGAGMGRRLLMYCLEQAKAKKFKICYLETLKHMVQARSLYESAGFERISAPMGATGHFGCDAWYTKKL